MILKLVPFNWLDSRGISLDLINKRLKYSSNITRPEIQIGRVIGVIMKIIHMKIHHTI